MGELLIEEKALISQSNRRPWFQPSEIFALESIEKAVDALSPAQQQQYGLLHGYIPSASCSSSASSGPNALQIYSTNAYPMGPDRSGIFPLISRLNSECSPNVHYNFDERRSLATVFAVAPIPARTELVNSYIGLYLPRAERRGYLNKNFGFVCTCPACESRTGDGDESDERRQALARLEAATAQALVARRRLLACDLVDQRLQLLTDEGLCSPAAAFKVELDGFLARAGLDRGDNTVTTTNSGGSSRSSSSSGVNSGGANMSSSGVGYTCSAEGSGGSFFQLYRTEGELQATARCAMADAGAEAGAGATDRAEASEWAQRALRHAVQSKGPLSVEAGAMRAFLAALS